MSLIKRAARLVAIVAIGSGCTPTCEQSCRKLLKCEFADSPRTSARECEDGCEQAESLYKSWQDDDPDEKLDRLREQRQCIGQSTCDEIGDGVCYDEVLDPF